MANHAEMAAKDDARRAARAIRRAAFVATYGPLPGIETPTAAEPHGPAPTAAEPHGTAPTEAQATGPAPTATGSQRPAPTATGAPRPAPFAAGAPRPTVSEDTDWTDTRFTPTDDHTNTANVASGLGGLGAGSGPSSLGSRIGAKDNLFGGVRWSLPAGLAGSQPPAPTVPSAFGAAATHQGPAFRPKMPEVATPSQSSGGFVRVTSLARTSRCRDVAQSQFADRMALAGGGNPGARAAHFQASIQAFLSRHGGGPKVSLKASHKPQWEKIKAEKAEKANEKADIKADVEADLKRWKECTKGTQGKAQGKGPGR